MRPMRIPLGLVIACLVCACAGASTSTFVVAVGASGALPTWSGACDTARATSSAVRVDADGFAATAPGDVVLACARGRLRLEARAVARLAIEGPEEFGPAFASYRVVAFDASGERLDLADASVAWTLPDAVERGSACHGEMIPSCDPPSAARLRRRGPGDGAIAIEVAFAGVHATRTFSGER